MKKILSLTIGIFLVMVMYEKTFASGCGCFYGPYSVSKEQGAWYWTDNNRYLQSYAIADPETPKDVLEDLLSHGGADGKLGPATLRYLASLYVRFKLMQPPSESGVFVSEPLAEAIRADILAKNLCNEIHRIRTEWAEKYYREYLAKQTAKNTLASTAIAPQGSPVTTSTDVIIMPIMSDGEMVATKADVMQARDEVIDNINNMLSGEKNPNDRLTSIEAIEDSMNRADSIALAQEEGKDFFVDGSDKSLLRFSTHFGSFNGERSTSVGTFDFALEAGYFFGSKRIIGLSGVLGIAKGGIHPGDVSYIRDTVGTDTLIDMFARQTIQFRIGPMIDLELGERHRLFAQVQGGLALIKNHPDTVRYMTGAVISANATYVYDEKWIFAGKTDLRLNPSNPDASLKILPNASITAGRRFIFSRKKEFNAIVSMGLSIQKIPTLSVRERDINNGWESARYPLRWMPTFQTAFGISDKLILSAGFAIDPGNFSTMQSNIGLHVFWTKKDLAYRSAFVY